VGKVRHRLVAACGLALVVSGTALLVIPPAGVAARSSFAVGIPTVVDPIRAGGEPMIAVDSNENAWVTAPAGSSAQTSFFWHSRDGGLTYPLLGPSGGHWLCPVGGGDSHILLDRAANKAYQIDQEALASLGFGATDQNGAGSSSSCAAAPAATADRPFQALLHSGAPQNTADGGKPIVYLSWACQICLGGGNSQGGLAFGWSDDGTTWHAADPGVPFDNLAVNTFFEAPTINTFQWHGDMVADPTNGYVYTAIGCDGGGDCPNGSKKDEFGIAVGAPGSNATNPGEFASETYQSAAVDGVNGAQIPEPGILFPVIAMDAGGTLYEAWTSGDATATSGTPPAPSLHIYYTYSKDRAHHYPTSTWVTPIRVDAPPSQAAIMPWIVGGDAGKLGFIWLGANLRQYPSQADSNKVWYPFMAIVQNANTATPTIQQAQVGMSPNHLSDVCLQGTVGCIQNLGNRNMADFISVDVGPDGALQGTWASDANLLATLPTTLIPGMPLTETARQVSGPKLIGTGDVSDTRFSTTPTSAGINDATGDALYPVQGGSNVPQLDLTGSNITSDGTNLLVHVSAANLASTASPDTSNQTHVWYLTMWHFKNKMYFAKMESDSGGTPTFTAGMPATYDRPGLNGQTVATLTDYSGGTAVTGSVKGNDITITVPGSLVGNPGAGSVLESVTGYTVLDNGVPPAVTLGVGNIPTITDATPAYNALLAAGAVVPTPSASTSTSVTPNTSGGPAAPGWRIALALTLVLGGGVLAAASVRVARRA